MNEVIKVEDLKKSYGKFQAVKGISFNVKKGQLFAFLGPNGAGKSTTIDILCTLNAFDSGKITINNHLVGKEDELIKNEIGIVFQDNFLDKKLTIKENLRIRAEFYFKHNRKKINEAIERVSKITQLDSFINRQYRRLSGGQRRRADIARALINVPKILFLDEPTTGLDPQTRKNIWEILKKLQTEGGMTIFLTTHYMEEANDANYVVVIDGGKVVVEGTPIALKEKYASDHIRMKPLPSKVAIFEKKLKAKKVHYTKINDIYDVNLKDSFGSLPLVNYLKPYLENFEVLNGTMDDVFLNITGKEIRE